MKSIKFFISLLIIVFFFNACANFQEDYKPLYQAKPLIESSKRAN